ncbi:MAG: hypothetical protein E6H80_10065 [Betaproteobacteria bacterium]|nr:MAG: hypothetical protein E6H80_10065 [Betaproteobacteria bacterium]
MGVEYLSVSQENVANTNLKYSGVALYGTYMFTPRYRGVLRYESFDDKDGLHFGIAGQKYKEVTVTGSYLAADNFEMRAEVRKDTATNPVFINFAGPLSKSLMTLALQGLYKF